MYDRLRDAILAGELAPGTRISPVEVGRELGVSAMPVREALRLLEQDGLVETASRRWTRVVELDPQQVAQLVPIVSLLEQYAVSTAGPVDDVLLEELRATNDAFLAAAEAGDARACIGADAAFHDLLVRAAANSSLERALRDGRARVRLLRPVVVRPELAAQSFADHDEIVEALAAGDAVGAAAAVERNWGRALERVVGEPPG